MSIFNEDEQEIQSQRLKIEELQVQENGIERSESELLRIKNQREINLNKAIDLIHDAKKSHHGFQMKEKDIQFVIEQLNQLKFFQDIFSKCKLKSFTQMCVEHLNVEFFSQGSILFHKGERIDKIHILTKGEIIVYQDKTAKELLDDQVTFKKTKNKNMSIYDKMFLKKNMRKLEYLSQGVLTVKNVQKLRGGDHFGDTRCSSEQQIEQKSLYLSYSNTKVFQSDLYYFNVSSLNKDIFENIMTIAQDEFNKKKLEFFKLLLPTSPLISLVQFIVYVKEKYYKYKEYIYQENELNPKYLFIINDGEVTIQIHPSEDLKKQYKTKVEVIHLFQILKSNILNSYQSSQFQENMNHLEMNLYMEFQEKLMLSLEQNKELMYTILKPKQIKTRYIFKIKLSNYSDFLNQQDLKRQTDLNDHILKLIERNSKLKSEFQQAQFQQIKFMNKEMEKQNEQILKKKETIMDQLITDLSQNQRKQSQNIGQYVDQNIIEQNYDVKSDIEDKKQNIQRFYNRTVALNQYSLKQRQNTTDFESQQKLKSISTISQRLNGLNNSYDSNYSANLNNRIYHINQSQNLKYNEPDNTQQTQEVLATRNHSQIPLSQNSQATLSANMFQTSDQTQMNKQLNLFINNLHRKKSHSVFISHGLEENIFQRGDDEEVLNNFSSIEKMRNVKVQNFNKLCDTQRNIDNRERSSSPVNFSCQIENLREEQANKMDKSQLKNTPSQSPINRSPSRKVSSGNFLTSEQCQQSSQNLAHIITQKHTKYPYMVRKQNIYDKIRIEDQSINNQLNVTTRIDDQINANQSKYQKSFTPGQRSKEKHYHHQISPTNKSPTDLTNSFRQKNDKAFSNIKNQFFTKKNLAEMNNFIFSIDNRYDQIQNQTENNQLFQLQNQSYKLNKNDLPLLNLFRIQHKQSIKFHSEFKPKSISARRQSKLLLNRKTDKEEKYLPTFHLDYSLM